MEKLMQPKVLSKHSLVFALKSSYLRCLLGLQACLIAGLVNADCVILLHGLARTQSSMKVMEKALQEEKYHVVNLGYSSRKNPIEELAPQAIKPALEKCPENSKVHFVTHSLGGILVREYLQKHPLPNLGRVVMLGPPNQGSEVVDELQDMPGFHLLNGDAGMQLGTDQTSVPNRLGAVDFELGIIAGSESINLILSSIIPGEDDGKVAIERTKVEGMKEHIILSTSHPFMMKNKDVIKQVKAFLKNGRFDPVEPQNKKHD